ncbi:MAG: hypothetical protein HYZ65_00520 [Burkholderiales bacterium]|nr:hypothetical protein [Burkholderiales bacterium]
MKYLMTILFLFGSAAFAGPGAHGPNGEHLDAPGQQLHQDSGPRLEAHSELFELVGRLQDGELSLLIDDYASNRPVLNARLEVEYRGMKTLAQFHADHGDYAVHDPRFLKALTQPGKHALMFTVSAGEDSDLLEGSLEIHAGQHPHTDRKQVWIWSAAGLLAVLALALLLRRRFI